MEREIEETLCAIQAQLCVQRVALRAIARTHGDPGALLASWRDALADAATGSPVVPAHVRHSEYLADHVRALTEDLTAELVELVLPVPGDVPAEPREAEFLRGRSAT